MEMVPSISWLKIPPLLLKNNIVAFVTTWLPMSEEMNYLTYSGYILARHSNFARAVYPALQHEIEAGIVSPDDG